VQRVRRAERRAPQLGRTVGAEEQHLQYPEYSKG
jgi:cob(I)alamin adenosyltransferase